MEKSKVEWIHFVDEPRDYAKPHCPECHIEVDEEWQYCPFCGIKLDWSKGYIVICKQLIRKNPDEIYHEEIISIDYLDKI